MKILLLGKNGQLGWELQRSLAPLGELLALDRHQADLSQPETLRVIIEKFKPNWIVNAAAYTDVDKAEIEQDLAFRINAEAVAVLAEEAVKIGAWLIHYSTDYVYDGKKIAEYIETDVVNPLSVYGKTKLAGEQLIQKSNCNYLIFRTSWVFATRGHNFVKTILHLARKQTELKIVADQFGAPTSAELLADITGHCITQINSNPINTLTGIYHLVSSGEATWHTYAKYVINKGAGLGLDLLIDSDNVFPITTEEYPLPAKRPKNSRLSTEKLTSTFNVTLPHWTTYVDRMMNETL